MGVEERAGATRSAAPDPGRAAAIVAKASGGDSRAYDDSRRVTFRFETDKLTLLAQGATAGRSKVQLKITYDGKPVDINFNPAYVSDLMKVLPEEAELSLDLIDGATPALFRSGPNYAYLVMPLT